MNRTLRVGILTVFSLAVVGTAAAGGGKPEDVFKGQIVVCKNRLPMKFSSTGAFISAVRGARTDRIWPAEQRGNDVAEWNLEYIAFFAQPLNDFEVKATFYDITPGSGSRMVASDAQMNRERGTRIFSSNLKLSKPEFEVNHRYMMKLSSGGRVVATTNFWLRGKGPNYTGKVEFSDDEAKKR